MSGRRVISVVGCHAGGEVGNVVVGGVAAAAGRDGLRADAGAPRGRLTPEALAARAARAASPFTRTSSSRRSAPTATPGFIIMEPTEYPPMSGSNTICVATVLLETGMVEMREPETTCGSRRLQASSR